jgi:predicted negative regulator of RcsB-dependent stress response
MKRTERHHLKENELTHVLGGAAARIRDNRRTAGQVILIVALFLLGALGYWGWKTRTETRAQLLLSDAIAIVQAPVEETKPGAKPRPGSYPTIPARAEASVAKFAEVYNAYPSTKAGIAARYYAAAALAMLGRPEEAAARYQEVVDRAGTDEFYGRMARLGVIQANAQAKQYDRAISEAQALVNTTDESMPRDALLMELGRVQAAAGKKTEAKQTLDRVIKEFPESAYIEEARQLLATGT